MLYFLIPFRLNQAGQVHSSLEVTEIFSSVQGESSLAGRPTTFVRLARCNLRCTWCDTPYSFDKGGATSFQELLDQVSELGNPWVCVTGGEPLLQKAIFPFMSALCDQGFQVSLETGGSLSTELVDPRVKVVLDIKCPGSGMSHKNHWENLDSLRTHDEVKFVIKDLRDYEFAREVCRRYDLFQKSCEILFSPVFGQLDPKELIQWFQQDRLPVRLNLQLHKFIWTPETRGV